MGFPRAAAAAWRPRSTPLWGPSRWASSPWSWPRARRKRCCRGADAASSSYHVAATPSTRSVSRRVLAGDDVGTYFSNDIARKPSLDEGNPLEAVGQNARRAARALQALEAGDRTKILQAIASKLRAAAPAILAANAADVADSGDVARELRQRLGLSSAKLETVAKGVEALANAKDPVFLRRPLFLLHLRPR